jgi:hypothetical protein
MNTVMNIYPESRGGSAAAQSGLVAQPILAVLFHESRVTRHQSRLRLSTLNFQLSSPKPIADPTSTRAGVDAGGPCAQVETDRILAGSAGRKCILFHGTIRGWLCD